MAQGILQLTAITKREGEGWISHCPEVDIASQGHTTEEAQNNLKEAVELFFRTADPREIDRRHFDVMVTPLEIPTGF